jgi:glycosyltransferase involved in cell wall biosynthesis
MRNCIGHDLDYPASIVCLAGAAHQASDAAHARTLANRQSRRPDEKVAKALFPIRGKMISVVIPVFNNADYVGSQLEAVCQQEVDGEVEVIVADNGSSDGSVAVARRWAADDPRIRVVDASARRGPGAARNMGTASARGDLVAFCDGDDVVCPGWLRSLIAGLESADIAVGALDVCTLNDRPPGPPLDPWPRQFGFLPAGLGANMAVRRAAFESVDGFDESLHVGEDLDLCWRMQIAGHRLERVMAAVVMKRGRPDGSRLLAQCLGYGRSDAVLFRRYRGAGMPRQLWLTVRSWAWLVLNTPTILAGRRRRAWVQVLFLRIGRIVGSIEQRTFYP